MAMDSTTYFNLPKPVFDDGGASKASEFNGLQDTADAALNTAVGARAVSPSTHPDEDIPRFDGPDTKTLQASGVKIDDTKDLKGLRARIMDPTALGDDQYVGDILLSGTAGQALAQWDLCYLKSDGKYWKARADAAATMPGVVLAVEAISAEANGSFLKRGYARNDAWSFGISGLIYADPSTYGAITKTLPSGSGNQVQILGYVERANTIWFEPNLMLVQVA